MSDLKPCPACGGPAEFMDKPTSWHRVACVDLCLSTSWKTSRADAAAIWNSLPRRADFTEPQLEMRPGQMITLEPDRELMRFEAAVAAMQGIISATGLSLRHHDVAERSMVCADALLAELAKERAP